MIDWDKKVTVSDKQAEHERSLKAQRDAAIRETDWMVIRHRDELESGIETTLNEAGYISLLEHRQSLRDWPSTPEWYNTPMPSVDGATLD